ncbi:hypothetical protein FF125_08465 [Aureibaculum algae]|uniref:TerB family tellurite resistance protein n=1 Tax=Aureibaculum algae TaxID=2584122 RepID=A0A5B7TNK5_9FLAO|nr:hypothetical protein [Aureibaculum algae]QCX38459.1 hypothetical protein FF125_08465 [Aureibaculum algae]
MENKEPNWTKNELKIYILLLCANADSKIKKKELKLIKSSADPTTFKPIYKEFKNDDEDTRFDKIEYVIGKHEYTHEELNDLKRDVFKIFNSDDKFVTNERYLEKVLDNILY